MTVWLLIVLVWLVLMLLTLPALATCLLVADWWRHNRRARGRRMRRLITVASLDDAYERLPALTPPHERDRGAA